MFVLWSEIGEWYSIPNIQTLKKKKKETLFTFQKYKENGK